MTAAETQPNKGPPPLWQVRHWQPPFKENHRQRVVLPLLLVSHHPFLFFSLTVLHCREKNHSDLDAAFLSGNVTERPAVRGFITYLNPKLRDDNIPRKSSMAAAVNDKVAKLKDATIKLIDVCITTLTLLHFPH